MPELLPGARIHFVGIGGAGLSAIARVLLERGYEVSGSDQNATPTTAALEAAGATVFHGHAARNVDGADMLLASSAVDDGHLELLAARKQQIPVYRRREFMNALLRGHDTIAVAGAHGKTTTTSMLTHIMQHAGKDPSYIVGGAMGNTGRNAGVGSGRSFIIEADEYGNMFHGLAPQLAVLTSVEHDHPDFFTTLEDLKAAFEDFLASIRPEGMLIVCADDPLALELALSRQSAQAATRAYAIENSQADWHATEISFAGEQTTFDVLLRGKHQGSVSLSLPGAHNVLNALAALAAAHERGVAFETSARALASFKTTERRFQIRGVRDGVVVVDDYAHHPTEIEANIRAARLRYPGARIWAVWQPHTYSRVQRFWADFIAAFGEADRVLVTPIYAAREAPLEGITSQALVAELRGKLDARRAPTFECAASMLRQFADAPAVLLIFSAGDANRIANLYLCGEA